jgi:hypothetical protein
MYGFDSFFQKNGGNRTIKIENPCWDHSWSNNNCDNDRVGLDLVRCILPRSCIFFRSSPSNPAHHSTQPIHPQSIVFRAATNTPQAWSKGFFSSERRWHQAIAPSLLPVPASASMPTRCSWLFSAIATAPHAPGSVVSSGDHLICTLSFIPQLILTCFNIQSKHGPTSPSSLLLFQISCLRIQIPVKLTRLDNKIASGSNGLKTSSAPLTSK